MHMLVDLARARASRDVQSLLATARAAAMAAGNLPLCQEIDAALASLVLEDMAPEAAVTVRAGLAGSAPPG